MLEKKDITKDNENFFEENKKTLSFDKLDSSVIISPGSELEKNYISYLKQKYRKFLEERSTLNE